MDRDKDRHSGTDLEGHRQRDIDRGQHMDEWKGTETEGQR